MIDHREQLFLVKIGMTEKELILVYYPPNEYKQPSPLTKQNAYIVRKCMHHHASHHLLLPQLKLQPYVGMTAFLVNFPPYVPSVLLQLSVSAARGMICFFAQVLLVIALALSWARGHCASGTQMQCNNSSFQDGTAWKEGYARRWRTTSGL